jgi:hypothetical protein
MAKRKRGPAAVLAAAKQQKLIAESPHYLCTSCDESKTESAFPGFNPNSACEHRINTCADCLKSWVNVKIESNQTIPTGDNKELLGISCPECNLLMLEMDVQIATTRNMAARFRKLQYLHQCNNTPDWRWCLEPKCKGGQIHKEDNGELFVCATCGGEACIPCDRPWHKGKTCEEFKARVKDRIDDEDKTLAMIKRKTKKCPNCKISIEKQGGCVHMSCHKCHHGFSWSEV